MNVKHLFSALLLCCLVGCAYQKPQMVVVDSNVSAFLYQGEKRIGETPFAGEIPRSEIGNLYLKRNGYKTVKIPAKKVYSRELISMTDAYFNMITDEKDGLIHGITLLPTMPSLLLTDFSNLTSGTWIEYIPNTFYVEMVPVNKKQASVDFLHSLQVKSFALKMYPSLASGDEETLAAFSGLSRLPEAKLRMMLLKNKDPVSFAEAAARF